MFARACVCVCGSLIGCHGLQLSTLIYFTAIKKESFEFKQNSIKTNDTHKQYKKELIRTKQIQKDILKWKGRKNANGKKEEFKNKTE